MGDHRFSKRQYATSCMFTLLFTMLVSASYFDIATCPYNSQGGAALNPNKSAATPSIFDEHFSIVPCHTIDVVIWTYVALFGFFMVYKWFMYRADGYHYFMLDYCYFHNACLCALIFHLLVRVSWVPTGLASLAIPVPVDITPVATAVGSLTSDRLSIATFLFFVILAGTFGPILGAILMWKNALLYHSFDKMISCYLHLAPAAVQGLLVHAALSSVRLRPKSKLRDHLKSDTNFTSLLMMHTLMFIVWQVVYHAVHEIRLYQRRRAFHAAMMRRVKDGVSASMPPLDLLSPSPEVKEQVKWGTVEDRELYRCMVPRTTAYTWMMEYPPMGKKGPLYKLVVLLGKKRLPSTVMFAVAQWIIHAVFFVLGFIPLYLSLIRYDSAGPLLLYTCGFVLLCIYNAAAVNKSWIKKLKAQADSAESLKAELEALKRDMKKQ
ncbi:transmembrane protein, putative [Bodo saltans]|uniref:Glycerophosphocholine acyltransferase 1 n=1 Tax=Bodo saltans TaxID=75058 RepID=A0A0S4J129_BODSA|nr:transmembrane protein, putative [Bodo saltans]|eukprot:CUG27626.1 transmembrane protein, putative [Bodo saltans]